MNNKIPEIMESVIALLRRIIDEEFEDLDKFYAQYDGKEDKSWPKVR